MRRVELGDGDLELELLPEAGGRIHRLRAFGVDLLRTPADPEAHLREPFFWGSYPLVPWSNRIPDGRLVFRGETYQLPLNFGRYAIHGEAYGKPWTVEEAGATRARLRFSGGGGPGAVPWSYEAEQVFELAGPRLTLEISMTNLAAVDAPAGLGIHPWFAAGAGLQVEVPARLVYPAVDCIPTGDPVPVSGERDLRHLREVPWGLDDLWTGLDRFEVRLARAEGIGLRWTFPPVADHVVLASFADFRAVALEPVTHATDGHRRLADGLRGGIDVLPPGAKLAVRHELEFSRIG